MGAADAERRRQPCLEREGGLEEPRREGRKEGSIFVERLQGGRARTGGACNLLLEADRLAASASQAGRLRTGAKLFIGLKVPRRFCFEICTPEGRKGKRMQYFKTKHTEPLTQDIP